MGRDGAYARGKGRQKMGGSKVNAGGKGDVKQRQEVTA